MSQSIYLLVLAKGPTEAWYRLSKEEQDKLWFKVLEVDQQAGAKWHITCNSRWADEETYNWSVIEYPSMEAYQKKVAELDKLGWWRYFSAKTVLGTLDE